MQRYRRFFAAMMLAVCAAPAAAVYVNLSHSDGEFVDRGTVSATVSASDNSRIDCAAGLVQVRAGNVIVMTARRLPGTYTFGSGECFVVGADLGTLTAGTYEIEARLMAVDGSGFDVHRQSLQVLPLEGRCNADPTLRPMLLALHKTLAPAEIAAKVASDPFYAERLGHPLVETGSSSGDKYYAYLTYPPLVDPTVMSVRLHETGEFLHVGRNGYACFSAGPPPTPGTFVEFHHAGLDHYFYSANAGEIAAIDAGKVGPWTRTGKSFVAIVTPGCPDGNDIVYRFYGIPGKGPNSHFFTRDRAECYAVDKSGQWALEGVPFYAHAPAANGSCGTATANTPLYRAWRPFGDSNHRYSTDRAVIQQMVAQGWVDEGPVMCVLPPG